MRTEFIDSGYVVFAISMEPYVAKKRIELFISSWKKMFKYSEYFLLGLDLASTQLRPWVVVV